VTSAPVVAYLGLGSNLGDRSAHLAFGVAELAELPGTMVEAVSSLYETPPWGVAEQPAFLNCCVALSTTLAPRVLLEDALAIESRVGRERRQRWGPRTLDIDILLYDNEVISEPGLSVPHPELKARAFALVPLAEIAPGVMVDGTALARLLEGLDTRGVKPVGRLDWKGIGE